MNLQEFKKFLEKYKVFRELTEQYRSTKFCKLYYKIYNYMLSIPKEKIVLYKIKNIEKRKRNEYIGYLFYYINCFLAAKDFYKWKNRIYSLLTEKLGPSVKKYKLLYNSKTKEFINKTLKKSKSTCIEKYNVEHPAQSKEVQDQIKATWQNKTQEEIKEIVKKRENSCMKNLGVTNSMQSKEVQEKSKETSRKKWGTNNPAQSKEVQDKMKVTCLERYGKEYYIQTEEFQEKTKATNLERYGIEWYIMADEFKKNSNNHSKSADNICTIIDNIYGNPEDSMYAIKNGEFRLYYNDKKNYYAYDYCIPSKKIIVEVDNPYWHALDKEDNELIKFPGNRIVLAKDIHKRDKEKEELAIKAGYKVFHIRDDEYKSNKSNCLKQLLKEIENYVHSKENMI